MRDLILGGGMVVLGFAWVVDGAMAEDARVVVGQTIVRAPEDKVMEAALATPDDAALAKIVRGWVKDGTGKVVSDVSTVLEDSAKPKQASWGKWVQRPYECDQDLENGTVTPIAFEPFLIGTSFETAISPVGVPHGDKTVKGEWLSNFSPTDEVMVTWPTWWPEVKKPKLNWLKWMDWYEQKVATELTLPVGGEEMLSIMRRADDFELNTGRAPTLDVTLVRVSLEEKMSGDAKAALWREVSLQDRLSTVAELDAAKEKPEREKVPEVNPAGGVAEVERLLTTGYSFYNLGDYDKAIKSFQEVIRIDPNNGVARRGMERAEKKRSESFGTARGRITVLTFGMKDYDAIELLGRGVELGDKGLLEELVKRKTAGTVALRSFMAVQIPPKGGRGARTTMESVRMYSYPTEMPTIPSAWGERPAGTRLEMDLSEPRAVSFAYEHHPAPPRRGEWPTALDMPELIMWQPQFLSRRFTALCDFDETGVALLGVMRTPECHAGVKGLNIGETLVVMAKLDDIPDPPKALAVPTAPRAPVDPFAPAGANGDPPLKLPGMVAEAVVFDVPKAEASAWTKPSDGLTDASTFAALLERVKQGKDVKIAAHVALATRSGQKEVEIHVAEEVMSVVEADPPDEGYEGRYRPTSMEKLFSGTLWKMEPYVVMSDDDVDRGTLEIYLAHKLKHDVAPPKQPDLKLMIAAMLETKGSGPLPEPEKFQENWEGDGRVKSGGVRFMGTSVPPTEAMKGRLHVLFVRGRLVGEGEKGEVRGER